MIGKNWMSANEKGERRKNISNHTRDTRNTRSNQGLAIGSGTGAGFR
jgi:hypothetical protein